MDLQSLLSSRVDRGAAPLAVGDVFVLVAFLTAGTLSHTTTQFLIENPLYLAQVLAPFLIGWAIAAPLVGAYSAGAAETAKSSVPLVVRSWIPAAVIGFVLRTFVFTGGVAPAFVAITLVGGMVVLGAWRVLYFKLR
ncbi:DUF3054 domain-containing protein [Halorubrum luteum]